MAGALPPLSSDNLLTAPDRRPSPALARARSRTARMIRSLLAFAVLSVVVVIFMWPELSPTGPQILKDDSMAAGANELVNPRFESVDGDRQPYTLTAIRARQEPDNPDLIHLEKPLADLALKDGAWLALQADQGLYHQDAGVIDLSGHVRLFHDEGYEMTGSRARIDMKTQGVTSDDPVSGQGPKGQIEAAGLKGDGATGRLIFTGPARLILNEGTLK